MIPLQNVLVGKAAFAKPENIIRGIPLESATTRPHGLAHSLYEELWHIDYWLRFSLADIRGEHPKLPAHSAESFPGNNATLTETDWQKLLDGVLENLNAAAALAGDEKELMRLFRPEKTVRDELAVIAAHNAYHLGRMVTLRQLLGIWSSELGDTW
jgi:DinB superfamily